MPTKNKQASAAAPVQQYMHRAPEGFEKWDKFKMASHIAKEANLGKDCERILIENSVTGKTASRLTENHLKEMGFKSIGERQEILHALTALRHVARQQKREALIWEEKEFKYHSWWSECNDTCCGLCPPPHKTVYKLFGAHLAVITETPSRCLCISCPCLGTDKHTDNTDLTYVTDVDSGHTKTPCFENAFCCGVSADWVKVKSASGGTTLTLDKGKGETAARLIKNQVEEHQALVKGDNPHH